MHLTSTLLVFALTAASAVFAAPTSKEKPEDCEWGYDWGKKGCNPKPTCNYGWDKEHKKCYEKPCDYGYDEHVSGMITGSAFDVILTVGRTNAVILPQNAITDTTKNTRNATKNHVTMVMMNM
jgi:hypothetical protein